MSKRSRPFPSIIPPAKKEKENILPIKTIWYMLKDDREIPFDRYLAYYIQEFFASAVKEKWHNKGILFFKYQGYPQDNFDNCEIKFDFSSNNHTITLDDKTYDIQRNIYVHGFIIDLPILWYPVQKYSCERFIVNPETEEYEIIKNKMLEMSPNIKIDVIQRWQNLVLLMKYQIQKNHIKANNNGNANEEYLWHGTRRINPSTITTSMDGFDPRLSSLHNLWGHGVYFSESPTYSHTFAFKHTVQGENEITNKLVFARVALGTTFDYGVMSNQTISSPVIRIPHEKKEILDYIPHYDSVSGITKNTKVYSCQQLHQAYPAYVISYKIPTEKVECDASEVLYDKTNIVLGDVDFTNTYGVHDDSIKDD